MTTRFAPSPTGLLHLGHAYSAKVAHDLARSHHGRFLLRFEDIDFTRVRPEFYQAIEEDLHWLGIDWDAPPIRQSDRLAEYTKALQTLRHRDLVYPCFCTRREIQSEISQIANAPQGPEGPLYPGTCRNLSPGERSQRLASGQEPSWRLNAIAASSHTGPLSFHDDCHGTITVDPGLLGDVILARKDIGTSYHLAVVVDDAFQEVTHVTRGKDLLASTHVHRLLQNLLGFPAPAYLHHPLITDDQGRRLAKRDQATALRDLRAAGQSPRNVLDLMPTGLPR